MIPPASTGDDRSKRNAVISIDQTNNGNLLKVKPRQRIFKIVVIKLIAPAIEEIPARCRLKIAKSTPGLECPKIPDSGGYNVQPVPPSTKLDVSNNKSAGGNNQKLRLFNLGNAISTAPIIVGTNQLPKPPIRAGITIKKIRILSCAVSKTLYNCVLWFNNKNWLPGSANSILINTNKYVPITPLKPPKKRYIVPTFLWLVEKSHLFAQIIIKIFAFKNNNTITPLLLSLSISALTIKPTIWLKVSRVQNLILFIYINIKDKGYETSIFFLKKRF